MARIRSTHPAQWTDENFVQCSAFGRLLALALRNEADDQGVFEWKPLQIKMRLFPADHVDVPALLTEIAAAEQVQRYDVDGKAYGAIRNFRKYQRPEKPNAIHPLPDDMRVYVGLSPIEPAQNDDDRQPVVDQSSTNPGKSFQREEGGGRREEEGDSRSSVHPPASGEATTEVCQQAMEAWNILAAELDLPTAKTLTAGRKTAIRGRLADSGGILGFTEVLSKIRGSPFLRGQEKNWRADFDFVLQASKFTKLREGGYEPRKPRQPGDSNNPPGSQSAGQRQRDINLAAALASVRD